MISSLSSLLSGAVNQCNRALNAFAASSSSTESFEEPLPSPRSPLETPRMHSISKPSKISPKSAAISDKPILCSLPLKAGSKASVSIPMHRCLRKLKAFKGSRRSPESAITPRIRGAIASAIEVQGSPPDVPKQFKNQRSSAPESLSLILHTWHVLGGKIRLEKDENTLFLTVKKEEELETSIVYLPQKDCSFEEQLKTLLSRQPFLKHDGNVHFALPLHTWDFADNSKCHLVEDKMQNVLLWRFSRKGITTEIPCRYAEDIEEEDRETYLNSYKKSFHLQKVAEARKNYPLKTAQKLKKREFASEHIQKIFSSASYPHPLCVDLLEELFHIEPHKPQIYLSDRRSVSVSLEPLSLDFVNDMLDFEISKIKTSKKTENLKSIYLKKIKSSSSLNTSVPIDRDQWAVTLINTDSASWHGHAALVIEGVLRGKVERVMADIGIQSKGGAVLPADVDYQQYDPGRTCRGKTETWPVPRFLAEEMISQILWEISEKESGRPRVYYRARGPEAFPLPDPIKVAEFPSIQEWVSHYKTHTPSQMTVYCDPAQRGMFLPYKVYLSQEDFLDADSAMAEVPLCAFSLIKQTYSSSSTKVEEYVLPDNCITWAKKKLQLVGVDLVDSKYKSLFTVPTDYIPKK